MLVPSSSFLAFLFCFVENFCSCSPFSLIIPSSKVTHFRTFSHLTYPKGDIIILTYIHHHFVVLSCFQLSLHSPSFLYYALVICSRHERLFVILSCCRLSLHFLSFWYPLSNLKQTCNTIYIYHFPRLQ